MSSDTPISSNGASHTHHSLKTGRSLRIGRFSRAGHASGRGHGLRLRRTGGVRTGLGERFRKAGWPALTMLATLGMWWAAIAVFDISPLFLPLPQEVVTAALRMPGYLAGEAMTTLGLILTGFLLAVATGLAIAAPMGVSQTVERSLMPPLLALNAIPKVALVPLLMLWLGLGSAPKIAMVWAMCVFPVLLNTLAGMQSTPTELGDLARSMAAARWQTYLKIRMPWALPQVFTGLRVAGHLAVVGAVVAEMIAPDRGLGALLVNAANTADTALMFAAVAVLAMMDVALYYVLVTVQRTILPWARATTG